MSTATNVLPSVPVNSLPLGKIIVANSIEGVVRFGTTISLNTALPVVNSTLITAVGRASGGAFLSAASYSLLPEKRNEPSRRVLGVTVTSKPAWYWSLIVYDPMLSKIVECEKLIDDICEQIDYGLQTRRRISFFG